MAYVWRLERVRDTKFSTDVTNEMLPDAAKRQGYTFTVSELLRENQQRGGESKVTPSPPQVRVKDKYLLKVNT